MGHIVPKPTVESPPPPAVPESYSEQPYCVEGRGRNIVTRSESMVSRKADKVNHMFAPTRALTSHILDHIVDCRKPDKKIYKTFRPKKKFEPGTLKYSLHKQAQASLNSGIDLKNAVVLPHGEDITDWLAVHVVDFFNRINLLYGTVCDSCTEQTCPTMSGGPKYEYHWADGNKYKKPTALPANQYIALLMDWVESQINNEDIFPIRADVPFPKNFQPTCKKILTRLFRVFVHVYIHHFDRLVTIGAEAHINTCYKHFYYFVTEFNLIERRELEPLKEMTEKICR